MQFLQHFKVGDVPDLLLFIFIEYIFHNINRSLQSKLCGWLCEQLKKRYKLMSYSEDEEPLSIHGRRVVNGLTGLVRYTQH